MDFKNRYQGIDEYATWLIKRKTRQLIGMYGFTKADRDDLEQELMIHLHNRLPKYDQDRSQLNTFIARIVENKVRTIIKTQEAGIRDYQLWACSLNESIEDIDGNKSEHIDNLDQNDYLRRTGRCPHPLEELEELSMDLRRVISSLPPELQDLCERLREETVSEISLATGIPRGTIYESIYKLRILLEEAGLKNYF